MGAEGGGLFTSSPYELYYYDDIKRFELTAVNTTTNSILKGAIRLACDINNINSNNKILFPDGLLENDNIVSISCQYYDLDTLQSNYIKITEIDSIDYYMKGEFEFTTHNECNDTIRVTDGYFDLNYKF